jgi:cysteine-rich repeat protein
MAPATDQDWYSFTIPVYADLWFETFDASGNGTCSPNTVDTMLQLFKSDCVTAQSAVQDQGGIGNCSRLNSVTQPATMKHLAPGTYRLKVYNYGTTNTYNYTLQAKYASYCGNGVVEGSEQCDGGGSCQADCTVAPTCGDGTISAGEQCDDGNMVNNDGCSSSCTVEPYYQCSGAVPNVCTKQEAICNDGIDNDNDGLIDAADPDCAVPAYFTACGAGESLVIYRSAGGVQTIPDNNATGITQSIVATMPGTIHRIALLYNITHPFDSDVDVYLTPPGAVSLDVSTDNGSSGDNFVNTLLDTTCSTGISAGTAPFAGCYKPETAFTGLIGTSPLGVWSLKVSDDAAGDVGTLNAWSLFLCTGP